MSKYFNCNVNALQANICRMELLLFWPGILVAAGENEWEKVDWYIRKAVRLVVVPGVVRQTLPSNTT